MARGDSAEASGASGPGASRFDLWLVRHGERVDETLAGALWLASAPKSRRFDPPLTAAGAEQAATAARTLQHQRAPAFQRIYASPTLRTLATAHVIAQALGIRDVRVVPGLCECAAAVRKHGLAAMDFASPDEMREICPEITALVTEAPGTFEGACEWLASQHRTQLSDASRAGVATTCQSESASVDSSAGSSEVVAVGGQEGQALAALVVTHREGIRDLLGVHLKLPYCAIAQFRHDPPGVGATPVRKRSAKDRSEHWRLQQLTDACGVPKKLPPNITLKR